MGGLGDKHLDFLDHSDDESTEGRMETGQRRLNSIVYFLLEFHDNDGSRKLA